MNGKMMAMTMVTTPTIFVPDSPDLRTSIIR